MGRVHEIGSDHQVFIDELRRVSGIRVNASDLGCANDDHVRLFCLEKLFHWLLPGQIQFTPARRDHLLVALALESTDQGAPHHAAMAGDKNGVFGGKDHGRAIIAALSRVTTSKTAPQRGQMSFDSEPYPI
jgi:hypothetical protein